MLVFICKTYLNWSDSNVFSMLNFLSYYTCIRLAIKFPQFCVILEFIAFF